MFRTRCFSRCLVIVLSVATMLPGLAQAQAEKGKKYALLVGVKQYNSSKFDPLQFTENDAEELAKVLNESGFAIRVLTTTRGEKQADAPTVANIRAAVKALLANKEREDTVLVALSGHGILAKVKERDESFFCPSDAQLNDNSTLLSLGEVLKDLDACGAGVKLLLVDACRNEPASGRNVDVDNLPRMPRGTAALFSCKSGERAFETAKLGKGHGVFFYHVLQGLKGEARNKGGDVTWSSLADYVIDKVSDEAPVIIGGGAKQTPELKVNLTGKSPILVRISEAERLFRLAREHIDLREAADLYRRADELGHPLAAGFLGLIHASGEEVKKDEAMAQRLCLQVAGRAQSEAEKGNVIAQYLLGVMYAQGRGVEKDEKEAVRWLQKAADKGDALAQGHLGYMYAKGRGVEKDEKVAVRWLRKAANEGAIPAQEYLGRMYKQGTGVEKDEKEAVRWLRKAADKGNAAAQGSLGDMYAQGKGVEKDEKEAARWFRKASAKGNVIAQNNLGYMYQKGKGVEKDEKEAVHWYRVAADADNAAAQNNLGYMYEEGKGVAKDSTEAVRWYRKAADQGHARGQSNLGWMCENGQGTPRDLSEARKWYQKAAEQGDQDAKKLLDKLPK